MSDEAAQGDGDGYGGMLGRDAGVFVDFLFSLVAVLIVALNFSSDELSKTTGQLRSTGLTREFILGALMCGYDNVKYNGTPQCRDDTDGKGSRFREGNFVAVLKIDSESGVLIAQDEDKYVDVNTGETIGGVFKFGVPAASSHGKAAIFKLRERLNQILPCFSAHDRKGSAPNWNEVENRCTAVREAGLAYIATRIDRVAKDLDSSALAVIDLIVFEGHSDGTPNNGKDTGEQRARNFLLAMLNDKHDPTKANDKDVITDLDAMDRSARINNDKIIIDSILYNLISVPQRLAQECALDDKTDIPHWCGFFSGTKNDKTKNNKTENGKTENGNGKNRLQRKQAPRIFALSSFGRYSLRSGVLNEADSRDRRVEIRVIMANVPRGLWETENPDTQRDSRIWRTALRSLWETENLDAQRRDLVRLISAQSAKQLLACDKKNNENNNNDKYTCLNDLVSSSSNGN